MQLNLIEEDQFPPESRILSVSALTRQIKTLLEREIGEVWIRGEISNFRRQSSGHCYFSLKDERSQVSAVVFRGDVSGMRILLRDGMQIIAFGQLSVYAPRGNYQLIVRYALEAGEGQLQLEYERLKQKLAKEGLFDRERKRALPVLPRRVGVITSPTGAAIRDFISILKRRGWQGNIVVLPAKVQGEGAAKEIVEMLEFADRWGKLDLLVVGRGGGSLEDIWPFNEEIVARAISSCSLPVISAVGHEIDFTLSDFAADKRAETPSAAAEMISSNYLELVERLTGAARALEDSSRRMFEQRNNRLQLLESQLFSLSPSQMIEHSFLRIDDLENRLRDRLQRSITGRFIIVQDLKSRIAAIAPQSRLKVASSSLRSLLPRLERAAGSTLEKSRDRVEHCSKRLLNASPSRILKRGFVLVRDEEGKLVPRKSGIERGQSLTNQFSDGEIKVEVTET